MKAKIMKRAWVIRKASAHKFDCKVMEIAFGLCLKQAWEESKMENGIKIYQKFESDELRVSSYPGKIAMDYGNDTDGYNKHTGYYIGDSPVFTNGVNCICENVRASQSSKPFKGIEITIVGTEERTKTVHTGADWDEDDHIIEQKIIEIVWSDGERINATKK